MAADAILTLAGSEWGYANENGPNERFVQFGGDSLVSGSGGCNRFSGRYDQAGDGIAIKDMGVTLMECFDSAVMDREAAFFKILNACRRIEATHLVLKLYGVDGALLAELARRDVD